ncbi:putative terbinafine resistance locus protein YIP1 [Thamnocephalis sphaerospora]|uniref:Protein YIP n=1 Tax=Thamnocephalis sphaerospora TaxID=78915 RepID=A0A4P9XSJ9_9FUNG|nr:putative terbinafine resistance locus protein YIP1 [Thamnocephalis sphaerospora]|eukprot:RKP09124.1 putative terbinafine resistance locus protein YIP1 [Thamnocephalis sphaerospora]
MTSPAFTAPPTGAISGTISSPGPQLDTLDEPVAETIKRDVLNVWKKLLQVLLPSGSQDVLRNWDLWGPLMLCLSLAILLSLSAPTEQSAAIFTGIFVIIWCGSAVVTLNAKLLGGQISFFQSVCVLGYCVFPLVVAALISFFISLFVVRLLCGMIGFAWATYASVGFLSDPSLANRRLLAVYPIGLFYFVIAWMVVIS